MINPETVENFGPWMLAPRRSRRVQSKPTGRGLDVVVYDKSKSHETLQFRLFTNQQASPTRFSAISGEVDEEGSFEQDDARDGDSSANDNLKKITNPSPTHAKGKRPNV